MKLKRLCAAIMLVSFTASAAEFTIDAPATAVVLYQDGALIKRDAVLNINETGVHTVFITQPLNEEMAVIDVRGAKLHSQSIVHRTDLHQPSATAVALANAKAQLKVLEYEVSLHEKLMGNFLSSLEQNPDTLESSERKVAERMQYAKTLQEKIAQTELEIQQLSAQLEDEEGKAEKTEDVYRLQIEVAQMGTVRIHLEESTHAARWQPYSTINLNTEQKTVQMTASARVSQQTGLDWHNVQLTLAMTPPQHYSLPPFYSRSVHLEEYLDPAASGKRMSGIAAVPMALTAEASSEIDRSGLDFTATLSANYDVLSDDSEQQITYWQGEAKTELYSAIYQWALPEKALLIARWTQPQDIHFFAGNMRILRDGLMITQRYESEVWHGGSAQKMSFGEDGQLSVTVSDTPDFDDKKGVINPNKVRQYRQKFVLRNLSEHEKPLHFYAQLPVSQEADVKVMPQFARQPDQSDVDQIKGILLWKETVPSNADKTIEFNYDISYPKDKILSE